jgi:2,3-bisphosphoglycerate-independent phosphoglycerate mutase
VAAKNKALLIILDGWGLTPAEKGNAPLLAKTPNLDYIYATYPKTSLAASGLEVGLNPGEQGNSEVGHLNLGSGRVVWENLPRIGQSIENGDFFNNPALLQAVDHAKKNNSCLHLWGLISDGGIHSHIKHVIALLDLASRAKLTKVLVHFITDGRDTSPKQAESFVSQLESAINQYRVGSIATMVGRYFAMDRDKNWDRVAKAYGLITQNEGQHFDTALAALSSSYAAGESDEFLEPKVIGNGGTVADNDAIIMFNFRNDRARQMLEVLTNPDAENFPHELPKNLFVATMTQYYKDQLAPVAFEKINLAQTIGEDIASLGLSQFHVAETEKYAHVTYFFNGGSEKAFQGENRVIVPSKKVATYDLAPEMSAREITAKICESIGRGDDLIVANYANGDMVGHTGNLEAAMKACEVVDQCLGEVLTAASQAGYHAILTADHGNCEVMIDEVTGGPNKEHTTNPVPFVNLKLEQVPFSPVLTPSDPASYAQYAVGTPVGILADVAPSVLAILGIDQPSQMVGMDLTTAL